jgi:hypothetical protein
MQSTTTSRQCSHTIAHSSPLAASSVQFAVARQPLALCSASSKVSSLTPRAQSSHRPVSHSPSAHSHSELSGSTVFLACQRLGGGTSTSPLRTVHAARREWSSGPCLVRPFVRPSVHTSVHCARRRASSGARSAAPLHGFLNCRAFHDPTVLSQSLVLAGRHPPTSTVVLSDSSSLCSSELVLQHVLPCRIPQSSSSGLHHSATRCEGRPRAARCASSSLRSCSSRCCTASRRRCTYRRSCRLAIAACTFVFILLVPFCSEVGRHLRQQGFGVVIAHEERDVGYHYLRRPRLVLAF